MRTRHLPLIVLPILAMLTGIGYRGSITDGTARLEAQQSPAVPVVPLPNREG